MATGQIIRIIEDDGWLVGELPNGEKVKFSPSARSYLISRLGSSEVVGSVVWGPIIPNTSNDHEERPWFCRRVETLAEEGDFEAEVEKVRQAEAAKCPELSELHQALDALIDQMTPEVTTQDAGLRLIEEGEDPSASGWQAKVKTTMIALTAEARVKTIQDITRALNDTEIRTHITNFANGNDLVVEATEEEEQATASG